MNNNFVAIKLGMRAEAYAYNDCESVGDQWCDIVSRKLHVSKLKNWMPKHSK